MSNETRIRSANAATLVAYPFGALGGWGLAKTGHSWLYTIVLSLLMAMLVNVIASAITRREAA
jgi:hypothetical protein